MKKNLKITSLVLWGLFYFAVFGLLLHNSFAYLDPDLGWHLGLGQRIAETGSVPKENIVNYPIEGDEWVDHEWLINLISFQIYDKAGYIALNFFFAGIVIAALLALHHLTNKYYLKHKSHIALSLFMLLGAHAMLPHLGIRMQEVAILFLAVLLLLLHRFEKQEGAKLSLLWLVPLFYVWTNLHGSFIIGLFILFFWFAIKITLFTVNRLLGIRLDKSGPIPSPGKLAVFAFVSLLAAASTLLTPYGIKIIDLFDRIHVNNAYHLSNISEWLPTYSMPLQYGQILYMALAAAAVLLLAVNILAFKKRENASRINIWYLALFALLLFLAFQSKRHFPLFFVVSLPLVVEFYSRDFSLPQGTLAWLKQNRMVRIYTMAGLLIFGAYHLSQTNFTQDPFSNEIFCQTNPCEAVKLIKNDPALNDLRLLNNYDWGGYIFWTWPGKKTFIDGRLPQHPLNGQTFLQEYHEFYKDKDKARDKLNEYGIDLVLYKKYRPFRADWLETVLFRLDDPVIERNNDQLKTFLEENSGWELIYENDRSKVYKRKNADNK